MSKKEATRDVTGISWISGLEREHQRSSFKADTKPSEESIGCVEASRQASRLGGVEDSWERGDEVKMEKAAGWIKV